MAVAEDHDQAGQAVTCTIGGIVVEAARLERLVTVLIGRLLCSDVGTDVVGGQSWSTLWSMCMRLVESRASQFPVDSDVGERAHCESLGALPELLRRANVLVAERNHVVHGNWFVQIADDGTVELETLRVKWGESTSRTWSLDNLTALEQGLGHAADEIGRHADVLRDFCRHTRGARADG